MLGVLGWLGRGAVSTALEDARLRLGVRWAGPAGGRSGVGELEELELETSKRSEERDEDTTNELELR